MSHIPSKYSIESAFEYCEKITSSHYENFPVASLLVPYEKRPYIQSIYAFARLADDFADEQNLPPEKRLELLNDWEDKLQRCYRGDADHPVFIALSETVSKLSIPVELLSDLLIAFKMDVTKNRYKSFDELLNYCKYSANPIGRLVLLIFGYRETKLFELSDKICTALQLTNFYQDIDTDLLKDRAYLPEDEMNLFNYSISELFNKTYNENFIRLMQMQIERTKKIFYEGIELIELVDKELHLELKLVWLGGMTILIKIERRNYNVFEKKIRLNTRDKILIFLRGLYYKNLASFKRKRLWDLT